MLRSLFQHALITLRGGNAPLRAHPDTPPVTQLITRLETLEARVDAYARSEATRQAEHATMLDALGRLYKRVSMRIAREQQETPASSESVLTLRQRLGR